jgi:RHS repeat-associated protein
VTSHSGSAESMFGFTGELQAGGLVHLRARDYEPSYPWVISRDSWEGNTSSPMKLNKWMYVKGNSVNRNDPSGLFPEEDIMLYMNVNSWADVIKQFEPGGRFNGNWGWLEIMRQAETGDLFYAGIEGEIGGYVFNPLYVGKFAGGQFGTRRPNGQYGQGIIVVDEYNNDDLVDLDYELYHSYWYQIRRKDGSIKFDTKAWEKYYHVTFDPLKVNWVNFSLDAMSTILSIIPGASASIQGAQFTNNMGKTIDLLGQVNRAYSFGSGTLLLINGDPNGAWLSLGSGLSSIFPGIGAPISGGFSLGCVYHDLEQSVLVTP